MAPPRPGVRKVDDHTFERTVWYDVSNDETGVAGEDANVVQTAPAHTPKRTHHRRRRRVGPDDIPGEIPLSEVAQEVAVAESYLKNIRSVTTEQGRCRRRKRKLVYVDERGQDVRPMIVRELQYRGPHENGYVPGVFEFALTGTAPRL